MRYSASKYSVALKTGLGVVQGHWKWRRSIDHTIIMTFYCTYSSIWYRFWVIWCWITLWPWNLGYRSLKIIQTGTIRKLGCGFIFPFHSNCGSILHHLRDKARYWSKIVIFHTSLHSTPTLGGGRNIAIPFGVRKLEWWAIRWWKKLWWYV